MRSLGVWSFALVGALLVPLRRAAASQSRPTSCPKRRCRRRPTRHVGWNRRPGARLPACAARPHPSSLDRQLPAARRREAAARQPAEPAGPDRGGRHRRRAGRSADLRPHRARLGVPRLRRRDPRGAARRGPVPEAAGRRSVPTTTGFTPTGCSRATSGAARASRWCAPTIRSRSRCRSCCASGRRDEALEAGRDDPRRGPARRADVHAAGGRLDQGGDPRAVGDRAHGAAARRERRRRGEPSGSRTPCAAPSWRATPGRRWSPPRCRSARCSRPGSTATTGPITSSPPSRWRTRAIRRCLPGLIEAAAEHQGAARGARRGGASRWAPIDVRRGAEGARARRQGRQPGRRRCARRRCWR